MSVSLWQCEHVGAYGHFRCQRVAMGIGPAKGLRMIGWQVIERHDGVRLLCPTHREDKEPCREEGENKGKPCSSCAAEDTAARLAEVLAWATEARRVRQ